MIPVSASVAQPLNLADESQQNQWGGFAIKYGILPLNPTFLPLKLTQGSQRWTVGSDGRE
jgi:hypothetical protein